MNGFKLTCA